MKLSHVFISTLSKKLSIFMVFFFCVFILSLSLRGLAGNPNAQQLNTTKWKDDGPLELSPDRGRFALTYSLIEDHSYQFSNAIGYFAAPDVASSRGRFVSLFAPTVSYIVMPGYIIGKSLGASQVGTFAIIAFFAVLNVILIRAIAIRLGAHPIAATIAALIFLFATPAFPYAVTLYQHHISTFLILLSLYVLMRFNNIWSLAVVWFCCALSISVDNPNLFFMFPIGLFAFGRLVHVENTVKNIKLRFHLLGLSTLLIMIIPIAFFMYFNTKSYGNPFQLAGTVASAHVSTQDIVSVVTNQVASESANLEPAENQTGKKQALNFFQTRRLQNGFYELFFSADRGILTYTPIMFLCVLGIFFLAKKKPQYTQLLLAILGANILLYSMWGDPYGGWAFGARYLIPTYAVLSLFLAVALTHLRKNLIFLVIFVAVSLYSISVNTIGAVTSNTNPPQVEVLALEALTHKRERYSFTREMDSLDHNVSKSFVYQETPVHYYLTAWQFTRIIIVMISSFIGVYLLRLYTLKKSL